MPERRRGREGPRQRPGASGTRRRRRDAAATRSRQDARGGPPSSQAPAGSRPSIVSGSCPAGWGASVDPTVLVRVPPEIGLRRPTSPVGRVQARQAAGARSPVRPPRDLVEIRPSSVLIHRSSIVAPGPVAGRRRTVPWLTPVMRVVAGSLCTVPSVVPGRPGHRVVLVPVGEQGHEATRSRATNTAARLRLSARTRPGAGVRRTDQSRQRVPEHASAPARRCRPARRRDPPITPPRTARSGPSGTRHR